MYFHIEIETVGPFREKNEAVQILECSRTHVSAADVAYQTSHIVSFQRNGVKMRQECLVFGVAPYIVVDPTTDPEQTCITG